MWCVFIRDSKRRQEIIAVYVDDLILLAETPAQIEGIKSSLSTVFRMTDMGQLEYCLGVNFKQTEEGIPMSQKQYLLKILAKYKLAEVNPISTPIIMLTKIMDVSHQTCHYP